MNVGFEPNWSNVDLGYLPNQRILARLVALIRAVPRVLRNATILRSADIVIARNFDLLVLAWLGFLLGTNGSARLVYECLDIHSLFVGMRPVNRLMRFLERRLLARIDLLLVSSPGFLRNYFMAVQGYGGRHAVIENKLVFDGPAPPRPNPSDRRPVSTPLRLGWIGSIRCEPSLHILSGVAERLGNNVEIAVHGNIHHHAVPEFDAVLEDHDNIRYFGPYSYPGDLGEIYLTCDAVWAQDLWQRGGNSDWLLPNRIYEASWFGCPSIAVAGTETGRMIEEHELGYVIDRPAAEALAELLGGLARQDLNRISRHILKMPDERFILDPSELQSALSGALAERASVGASAAL